MLGFIKGFIEKNTWIGLEEFYDSLSQALIQEYNIPPAKAKRRIRKSAAVLPNLQTSLPTKHISVKDEAQFQKPSNQVYAIRKNVEKDKNGSIVVKQERHQKLSWVLVFLLFTLISFNVILFIKLWKLEDSDSLEIMR